MSIKVSAWVWKHAKHRGTQKLLLLALADFANDSGVCWPSVSSLADRIGEGERHIHRLIKELVASGDLIVVPGGGRGKTTRYGIAVGLNARQREKLNTVLQNSVSQNSVLENTDMETVTSECINSDIWGTETVTSEAEVEEPNSAPEPAITARQVGGIRHGSVMNHDPVATQPAQRPPHQALMDAYASRLGYPIPNGGKEAAAARKILKAGYTAEQMCDCYDRLKTQTRWSDRHLSLQIVYEEIGAGLTAREQSNGRLGTHQQARSGVVSNGTHPAGSDPPAGSAERGKLRRARIDW